MKVTVKLVEQGVTVKNRTGGSYTGTSVIYTNPYGETITKGFANTWLDGPYGGDMKSKLAKIASKTPIDVIFKLVEAVGKDGKTYQNIVDILPAGSEDTSVTSTSKTVNTSNKSYNKYEKTDYNTVTKKDITIARSVAVKLAGDTGKVDSKFFEFADAVTAYILKPYGVDALGNPLPAATAMQEKKEVVEEIVETVDDDVEF